ncbi:MAG: hypothetical protein RR704_04570 [Stenotrophomonas sp.]
MSADARLAGQRQPTNGRLYQRPARGAVVDAIVGGEAGGVIGRGSRPMSADARVAG